MILLKIKQIRTEIFLRFKILIVFFYFHEFDF